MNSLEHSPDTRAIVYVANAAGNAILVFALDERDGCLTEVQRCATGARVGPLTISADRRVLYAALREPAPAIAAFAIDPHSGKLTAIARRAIVDPAVYLNVDRSGRYLLAASYSAASFAIYPILAEDGIDEPTERGQTPPHAHCIITAPSNRYLYVTSLGGDIVLAFGFDAETGRTTPLDPAHVATPPGSGPRHLIFHPGGAIAYVNSELDGSIGVYAFDDRSGRLAEIQRVSTLPAPPPGQPWGADLVITPDGRFVYATERRSSTLAVFAVRPDSGLLDRRAVIETRAQPRSCAVDDSGCFLIVAGEASHDVAVYAIDRATGELRIRACNPAGEKPAWVCATTVPESEQKRKSHTGRGSGNGFDSVTR